MIQSDQIGTQGGGRWIFILLTFATFWIGAAAPAQAVDCSSFPNGVLDGFVVSNPPSQIKIDRDCTIRNFTASNPLPTNFAFQTEPGQTDERWLVIFDNVFHNGQMACNSVAGHIIWFTNGSSTTVQEGCQNLLIPVEKIDKQNPVGTTTAAVGVPFTYTLKMPVLFDPGTGTVIDDQGSLNELHTAIMTDDLNEAGVDLTYVSHLASLESTGLPVSHSFSNVGGLLTFSGFPIIPAGEQIIIELTVVLDDSPVNTLGTSFINTARWSFGRLIDGVFHTPLPGENGISPPLTIGAPSVVFTKTGPATLNLGQPGDFVLDAQNGGTSEAWNPTVLDQLPDGATGGFCDTVPTVQSVQVFASDGVTSVPGKGPLAPSDYTTSFTGAPTCEWSLTILTAEGAIAPTERLVIRYQTVLDADTEDAASLTNIAGVTQWWNGASGNPDRISFDRTLTDGTVGTLDHEDAHTVTTALSGFFFEKTVENVTTGTSPSASAKPGDTLRYSLRLQTTASALNGLTFVDDLGAMNPTAVFVPGSLALDLGTVPPGADASNTDPNAGTNNAGVIDIRNIDVPANSEVLIQFEIVLDAAVPDGTIVSNQADVASPTVNAPSDDPNINGQADSDVPGDEDPTEVVVTLANPGALLKENTQPTASIGEAFRYRITVPETPFAFDLYDVRITDDFALSAADLRLLGVTRISGSGSWTPVNTGTPTLPVIEDPVSGIDIPAGEQIILELEVVLEDTLNNTTGLSFTNTADYVFNALDDNASSERPGDPGTSPAMTIIGPDSVTVTKNGPVSMTVGNPESFLLDLQNTGDGQAWNLRLVDQLPNDPTAGTCDSTPSVLTAEVFESNGVTSVSGPLVDGTDYDVSFQGDPICTLTITMLSTTAVVGATQRLMVTYQTSLDVDSQDGATLTNVAGATEWYSADGSNPDTRADRRLFQRVLTDGTPLLLDHQDTSSAIVALPEFRFEKTVVNVTTTQNPGTLASPGDVLRYRLFIENLGTIPLDALSILDVLDSLNVGASFEPGSLQIISAPLGADTSNTNSTGGPEGTGILDVRNLSLPGLNDSLVIEFEATLAPVLTNGTVVANQSQLSTNGVQFTISDDPNVNGQADPFVAGDEDPTALTIVSAPAFQVQKISTDLTGDPAVLLAGETLRYTITVSNIGDTDALDAILRDAIPTNTSYVIGSTTLNGVPVADGGTAPFVTGLLINAPNDPTLGTLLAGSTGPGSTATLIFDVVVDPATPDGTIVSNQSFVSAIGGGVVDQPSDDPATSLVDDPTRDVVGNSPLLFAPKSATILIDGGTIGSVDPGDVLLYTIQVHNDGPAVATDVVLMDAVPNDTTYRPNTLMLNTLPVGQPDGGVSPLIAGIPISSDDLTPPVPAAGAGQLSIGGVATVTFEVQVNTVLPPLPGTLITNQATVSTAELPDVLTDGDGNPSTGPEPTVVVVGDGQQLAITKDLNVVGGGPALAGSRLEYVVRVTNIGTVPANDVVLTDDLDQPVAGQLTYVTGSATLNGSNSGVTVLGAQITADYSTSNGPLAPGAQITLRFLADLDLGLAIGTIVTNTGTVTWNAASQNASASVSVALGGTPGVGTLDGSIWHDRNFDRMRDILEIALDGWIVDLDRDGLIVATTTTDSSGAYGFGGVAPNDLNGNVYSLSFRAPDAGANTASLGRGESAFTNEPQRITDILVTPGSNILGLDLPIDPNGVVYQALLRAPIPGATVRLLSATSQVPVSESCFDDPNQQAQVTGSRGYYKFDLNFGDASCLSGRDYLIEVVAPAGSFASGPSAIIPAQTDRLTAPFDVPACPGSANDAIPTTAQHCEVQTSELAPPPSVPAGSAGTSYFIHVTLDASTPPGSSQLFNNHIALDPVLSGAVSIRKTTPSINVSRGDLVPYEISFDNSLAVPLPDLTLFDRYPAGFRYVEGSARVDGVAVEPTVNGRELEWTDLGVDAASSRTVVLLLAVGAGVSEGEFVNRAHVASSVTGFSREATATVRVVPDPTFDCTDVFGKVFDDRNRDGMQDPGEEGLASVRLMTVRGLAVETDPHGRFHITCAVVPNETRGSNFVLKLDDRTLPSGFRMTTRQTQVKRATRGKALRFSYGATIDRVIGLDLADPVFEPGTSDMRTHWASRIPILIDELEKGKAILRLSYLADLEPAELVRERLEVIETMIREAWKARGYDSLEVESEIFWRRGESARMSFSSGPKRSKPGEPTRRRETALPQIDAGPPGIVSPSSGHSGERHFSTEVEPTLWSVDPEILDETIGDEVETRTVVAEKIETVKLKDVVPPIRFESGDADIAPEMVETLRQLLQKMESLENVRLYLIGHADDQALSPRLRAQYGDNEGLSRERAGEVAELLQTALSLTPESISYSWAGDSQPVAPNTTPLGRAKNRRVEVEIWYDEAEAGESVEEVVIQRDIKRFKVCRTETLCMLRYRAGEERRVRVKNLIRPHNYQDEVGQLPERFLQQIQEALENLRDKQNVTVKLIAHTDDIPLDGREARIYGNQLASSRARAHRVALQLKDALHLPTAAIASDGRGASRPVASNSTPRGRALNRRIEVEFWYDDPLLELPDEPQICPDASDAEFVTRVYEPSGGIFEPLQIEDGEALIPSNLIDDLARAMAEIQNKENVRLRFIGYTANERLTRRMADVYGDDIGLSAARARRTMKRVQDAIGLEDDRVEHEGRGFVHADDVVNGGFLQGDTSHVVVQVVYDELAVVEDRNGIEITPITRELEPQNPLALNLMRITVDGVPIDDPERSSADIQRCTDVALDATDIRFTFDDLHSERRLSVTSVPTTLALDSSEPARFRMGSNYPHFIERAEVRIFDLGVSVRTEPLAVVPIGQNGLGTWRPADLDVEAPRRPLQFLLRAYGEDGVFDETAPQSMWLVPNASLPFERFVPGMSDETEVRTSSRADVSQTDASASGSGEGTGGRGIGADTTRSVTEQVPVMDAERGPVDNALLAGHGESEAMSRNIDIGSAGTVRVAGSGIPPQHSVWIAGTQIPTNEAGEFVGEVLLPSGLHTVEVAVLDEEGNGELFQRDLELTRDDWFFVGIADLTLSADLTDGPDSALDGNNSTSLDDFANGRLAFFTQGKFGEDWKLTAHADTQEGPVESLFTNFLDKSPDALFRRLDPDYHYPTFGDDSTIEEQAPSLGKFYAKLSKNDDYLLWGNFVVRYNDNELALVERGLYGANLRYQSDGTTRFGERRYGFDGFAADPGTLSSREEFQGTGGSVYFLKRQDLLIGSERLRIEIRDKSSGLVSEVVQLQPELDYDIDYLQGRILLSEPLATIADDRLVVRSDGLSGNDVVLVVQYEFTPGFDELDTLNTGAQAHAWLGDFVKLGVTANRNEEEGTDNSLYAADLTIRKDPGTWFKVQAARSDGLVSNANLSRDGGYTFDEAIGPGFVTDDAFAYRADLSLDLLSVFGVAAGKVSFYGERREAGYSAPGLSTQTDTNQAGGVLRVSVIENVELVAKADWVDEEHGLETVAAEVDVDYAVADGWKIQVGVRHDERRDDSPAPIATQEEGDRTDAVVQLEFDSDTYWRGYAFGQATVRSTDDRDENNRGGIGGKLRVSDRMEIEGEVSHGDLGPAAEVGTTFQQSERTKLYMNYALDNERGYDGLHEQRGSVVVGSRSRLSDSASVYVENQYQHSAAVGLTRSMGITYAPSERWSMGFNWEDGKIHDRGTNAETERRAGGASLGYSFDKLQASSGFEYVFNDIEQSDGSRSERTTWLFRNNLKYQINPDGRLIVKFNHAISDSSEGDFFDGGFTEAILGYAYRPIEHDRFNALLKYTYFYNVPGVDQEGQNGNSAQFIQKSHVASLDVTYDLTKKLTLGAKYAYRLSQVSLDRENTNFFDNDAHLAILRADWRFLDLWEGSLEGRLLELPDLDERRAGALVTLYRYVGEYLKLGVGYNFTDFSEDLTDLSYDQHGVFFNVVGSF